MKSNKLAQIALLLWLVTIAVIVWFFIRGSTVAGTDGRTAIVLQPRERELVLTEMRGLLAATQGILEGANQGDMPRIIEAARAGGHGWHRGCQPGVDGQIAAGLQSTGHERTSRDG